LIKWQGVNDWRIKLAMKKQTTMRTPLKIFSLLVVVTLVVVYSTSGSLPTKAETIDQLRAQANELQSQIEANNAQADKLAKEADSLKKKIAEYDLQISQIDIQISLINTKLQQLDLELQKTQKELDRQKEMLKASVKALYKKGGASAVELLVGSDSFSDFINDQTYLETLKSGIQDSAKKVIVLKQQIQTQQEQQKVLLRQQQDARGAAANARGERQSLLDSTQGQEANYRNVSKDLAEKQKALLAKIVAQSRVITNVGTGSYPWASYREGSWNHDASCNYGDDIDPWGYCYRQCVSYVAWKLYATGHNPPNYYGNAADWMWRTPYAQRGYTPRVGAVAVWGGYWGHVAYVEEVYANGEIRISEYNAVPALQGRYSQRVLSADNPSMYLYY
jgi:surface antigen